jgi:SAM-dependent methyltransferase
MANERLAKFVAEQGAWTAMAIKLSDGTYTRAPAVDYRLRRLVQVAADAVGKPLKECRVLDLACLEGHYAIEFAAQGAEAVGTEGRAASVAKCDFVRDECGFDRLRFVQQDVRDLTVDSFGRFDIVICSGLLYHLEAKPAIELLHRLYDVCSGILLLDTFISLNGRVHDHVNGKPVRGHYYHEHNPGEDKTRMLWASLDNDSSFWLTEASIVNALTEAGFTSVMNVITPTMPGLAIDRKTYLGFAGKPAPVLTSDPTADAPLVPMPEDDEAEVDPSQSERSFAFRTFKRVLPQGVKDVIKPALRAVKILPPDPTPDFLKEK